MSNPVACVLFDVDEMQKLNEHRGYQYGDTVLADLRAISKALFPDATDIRFSGDEVILFLNGSNPDELQPRVAAVARDLECHQRVGITFALGIRNSSSDAKRAAMESLFEQKQKRFNQKDRW